VSRIDTSTTFLGLPLRIPVMLAPIGSLHDDPGGALPGFRPPIVSHGAVHLHCHEPKMEVLGAATADRRSSNCWCGRYGMGRSLSIAQCCGLSGHRHHGRCRHHGHRDHDSSAASPRQFVK
jgi:hypothetical protein